MRTRLRAAIFRGWLWDARQKQSRIQRYLPERTKILDIGAGSGSVTLVLREAEYCVTPVDVRDWSLTPAVVPELYAGRHLHYADRQFDTALLLTVLHHCHDPDAVIREAARVADRLIVIEDVHRGRLHRLLTLAADSILNLEFRGHPHNNRSHDEWRETFERLGLRLLATRRYPMLKLFRQQLYWLESIAARSSA